MGTLLPLFPLNIVVFPHEQLNLHIFEPRYKNLIRDCMNENSNFGIPVVANGLQNLGTEIEIQSIEKVHPNGELDIITRAKRVFQLEEYLPAVEENHYDQGMISFLKDDLSEDQTVRTKILDIFDQMIQLVSNNELRLKDNPVLSYRLGHHIALNVHQEFELLQMRKEEERQAFILNHLQKMMPTLLELDNLKERIKQNGHFKPLSSPDIND